MTSTNNSNEVEFPSQHIPGDVETKTSGILKSTFVSVEKEHELVVSSMATKTGQEKDVCYFYLESANWNLTEAIELMQNMDALKWTEQW